MLAGSGPGDVGRVLPVIGDASTVAFSRALSQLMQAMCQGLGCRS